MISQHQYQEMLARTGAVKRVNEEIAKSVVREKDLHEEIINECARREWIAFHSRMDRRPTNQVGTPDFIIATNDGRTFYIECKRPGAKCTPAQNAMLAWLKKNQQKWAVVTSLQEFIEFVNQQTPYLTKDKFKEIVERHES